MTTAVGAIIEGDIDLRLPLTSDAIRFLRNALLDHGVIFFHGQDLSDVQMESFAAHFGKPIADTFPREGLESAIPGRFRA